MSSFGGTVKLTGESEYKKALKDITTNIKLCASELKVASSAFDKNAATVKNLENENKALSAQLDAQRQKVSKLGEMVDASAKQFGENAEQTRKFKTEMNNAAAEANKMQGKIDSNTKTIKEMKDSGAETTDELKKLKVSEDEAGKSALKMGDLIKANLISDAIIGGVKKLGSAMASAAKSLVGFAKQGIETASNLEEVQNVVDVTFGDSAGTIDKWAKAAATSYGMSELSAKKYTGTMGAMLKSMGMTENEVANMSTSMVGLAGDFASFYNLDSEEAFSKIRAGIAGETEPLKQLGINMSVANLEAFALSQGINKSYKSMTQAEQATLRYNYLMQAGADAQGDFARTSDSFANQQRIAQLQIENLAAAVGSKLLPIVNEGMKIFNDVLSGEATIEEGLGRVTSLITDIANRIVEALPQIAAAGMQIVQSLLQGIQNNLPTIIQSAMEVINTLITGLIELLPMVLEMGMTIFLELVNGIATSLPELIPTIVEALLLMQETIYDNLDQIIEAGINILLALVDGLMNSLPKLIEKAPVMIGKLVGAIVRNLPKILSTGVQIIGKLVSGIGSALGSLLSIAGKMISTLWSGLTGALGKFLDIGGNIVKGIWNGISNGLSWIKNKITGWVGNVLGFFKKILGIGSPSKVMSKNVGTHMATGVGVGFINTMKKVEKDMGQAIPTDFETPISVSTIMKSENLPGGAANENMVKYLVEALQNVEVVMSGERMGRFIVKTVGKEVFA